jgi:urea transporter
VDLATKAALGLLTFSGVTVALSTTGIWQLAGAALACLCGSALGATWATSTK